MSITPNLSINFSISKKYRRKMFAFFYTATRYLLQTYTFATMP